MTIAMIITTAISLALLTTGLKFEEDRVELVSPA